MSSFHTQKYPWDTGDMRTKFKDTKVEDIIFLHPTYCNGKLGIYWNGGFIMSQRTFPTETSALQRHNYYNPLPLGSGEGPSCSPFP